MKKTRQGNGAKSSSKVNGGIMEDFSEETTFKLTPK